MHQTEWFLYLFKVQGLRLLKPNNSFKELYYQKCTSEMSLEHDKCTSAKKSLKMDFNINAHYILDK